MVPDPDRAEEAEGVLNPASGYGPDGRLYLLPRVVAQGNYSRVGLAEVVLDEGYRCRWNAAGSSSSLTRGGSAGSITAEWRIRVSHGSPTSVSTS